MSNSGQGSGQGNQDPKTNQSAGHAGKNITQVGGNYTTTSSFNLTLWVSLFAILALGGLAWAFTLFNQGGQLPSSPGQASPSPAATSNP